MNLNSANLYIILQIQTPACRFKLYVFIVVTCTFVVMQPIQALIFDYLLILLFKGMSLLLVFADVHFHLFLAGRCNNCSINSKYLYARGCLKSECRKKKSGRKKILDFDMHIKEFQLTIKTYSATQL